MDMEKSIEKVQHAAVIADAVSKATLTTWSGIHGGVRDAICIPHPPGEDGCWGDYPAETLAAIEAGALARLAPGRTVVDRGGDEDGDYLILADLESDPVIASKTLGVGSLRIVDVIAMRGHLFVEGVFVEGV